MTIDNVPVWALIVLFMILLTQSICLFLHARHRNYKFYWLWGLFGMIQFPCPTLLYILFVVKPWRNKKQL